MSLWIIWPVCKQLSAMAQSWRLATVILLLFGICLGAWFAFYLEYQVSTKFRFAGFPIPIVIFHYENGEWIDFVHSKFEMWIEIATNFLSGIALSLLPVKFFIFIKRRQKTNADNKK